MIVYCILGKLIIISKTWIIKFRILQMWVTVVALSFYSIT